jgi:cobalt-zinc-cadmium efflux system membrane fusion protein
MLIPIAVIGLAGCDNSKKTADKAPEKVAEAKKPLRLDSEEARRAGIKVVRLALADLPETIAVFGTIEPNRDRLAQVVPPVAGRVVNISARRGDLVAPGAVLAVIESPEIGEARAAYRQAASELNVAKANLRRTRSLVSAGSIARKEGLRAAADYEKARATIEAASAKLASLGAAAVDPPGDPPAALAVRAPFAGTVIEKAAVLGEYVEANRVLFTIGDLSALWIETSLFERDLGRVAVAAPAAITVAAYPEERFTGKVTYISSTLDRETRAARARVEVSDPDGRLKPGMFANVRINTATHRPVLSLPDTALVLLQGQMTAFVADAEGFEPRPVETGARSADRVVVKSGLEPGDNVVVSGAYALKARLLKSQISAD